MKRSLLILGLTATALVLPASAEPGQAGWVNLLDGTGLTGWTQADGKPVSSGGWVVEDGVLCRKEKAGDIFTAAEYGDFELTLEWKISPKGNSGVKYRVKQFGKSWLGPEYQILDDGTPADSKNGSDRHSSSLYYLKAADPKTKKLKPVGEWNTTRIIAKGGHFQHYLNGAKVVDITVGSDEWKTAYAKSKFKDVKGFAENPKGKIMLQDHGAQVWFRKIQIREL